MEKSTRIKTFAFQLAVWGVGITGMISLLLCLQTPRVSYCFEAGDNDTVLSSGGFENDVAALLCNANTRKSQLSRNNNSSGTATFAETPADTSSLCFKIISKIHNKTDISSQLNPNCDFIVHTTPSRASPYSFIA